MARIFVHDGREFPDPDPALAVDDVRRMFADFLPDLTNADVREERRGEDVVYTFTRRLGTKGARRRPGVVAVLRRVPAADLRVFELAAELLDAHGELDVDAAAARQPELHLAIAQAEAYARFTRQARDTLLRLPPR
jgi:PRTRC genetic system protein C